MGPLPTVIVDNTTPDAVSITDTVLFTTPVPSNPLPLLAT